MLNDCFDTAVRITAYLWSWKTQKSHGKGHRKSWNFKSFKEYEPCFVYTVKPLLSGHPWDLPKCPLNRGCPLNKGL